MSANLDKSLDEILATRQKSNRNRRQPNAGKATKSAPVAPVGGIRKPGRLARTPSKGASSGASAPPKDSKIIISGLPADVNEKALKEYFVENIGPVKRVFLTYTASGKSAGIATIIFHRPDAALKAANVMDGVKVDQRPITVEVIVTASVAASNATAPELSKSLGDRVAYAKPKRSTTSDPLTKTSANSKAKPKSAIAKKNSEKKTTAGGKTNKRGKNANRKPKTVDELDADMAGYFEGSGPAPVTTEANGAAADNSAPPAATGGEDLGMDGIS